MNKADLKYNCIDCGKNIHAGTFLYRGKRCGSCARKYLHKKGVLGTAHQKSQTSKANKGNKNGMYKNGDWIRKWYCKDCGKECSIKAKRCKSCSEAFNQIGSKNSKHRKIGTKHLSGKYIKIKINEKSWVLEHRYKVEKYLQRKLKKNEIIHHIDGNETNNNLSNLYIFEKRGLHTCLEMLIKYKIISRFCIKSNLIKYKVKE